jgi:sporulation protein YlmC with PRC-barrel domain
LIDILYELMDQNLIDSEGERAGRVDDIVVEDVFDRPARVVALLAGCDAKSRHLGRPVQRLSLWLHWVLGLRGPIEPIVIAWEHVERVENDVILNVTSGELGLNRVNQAAARRFIGRIPGAKP